MIVVALITALATTAGVVCERRLSGKQPGSARCAAIFYAGDSELLARRVLDLMIWVLSPPITFVSVVHLRLDERIVVGIGFGAVAIAIALGVAYLAGTRLLSLPRSSVGALMVVAAFANTGFLGLPVVTAVYGGGVLPEAIAYDFVLTTLGLFTVGFAVGAAFGDLEGRRRDGLRAIVTRNPPLWSAIAGLLAPAALAPDWAVDATHVLVYALPVLGFFAVGISLALESEEDEMAFPPPLNRPVATALVLKLALVPGVVVALSAAVSIPAAFAVQSAMASAINCLTVAHLFALDRRLVAATITWSTAIVVGVGTVISVL